MVESTGTERSGFAQQTDVEPYSGWTNLKAGLLRTLSGCTQREVGFRNGRRNSSVCRDLQEHRALLKHAPDYENLHAKIANDVIETMRVTARVAAR